MKRLIPAFTLACCAWAQTATVTFPTSGATISSYWPTTLTGTCNSCTSVYSAEWDIDGESIVGGFSRTPPYSFAWPSYNVANGVHTVSVTYRNALNAFIATSPAVSFTVANALPQNTATTSSITVTTGPAPTASINASNFFNGVALTLETTGTSTVSQPVTIKTAASPGTSLATASFRDTAGAALIVFTQWSVSASITVTDHEGNTYACGTANTGWSGNHINIQMCVAPNIAGSSTNYVTISYSGTENTAHNVIYVLQATNVATSSPIDPGGSANITSSGGPPMNMTSGQLAPSQSSELILYGVAYGTSKVSTIGGGYTAVTDTTYNNTALLYAQQNGLDWFGNWSVTVAALGNNNGSSKGISAFIDGDPIPSLSGTTAATSTMFSVSTPGFLNQTHSIVITENGPNCSGCTGGSWDYMGSWEQQVTFANPVVPMQLLASAREVTLCTTAQTNCPTSYTLTGTDQNTDTSTTSATISSCVAASGVLFTISGTCTVTQNGAEVNYLTMTDSNGLTRQVWVIVKASNVLPHFGTDGQIHTSYSSGVSMWAASLFTSDTPFMGLRSTETSALPNPAIAYGAALANNGFNLIEHQPITPGYTYSGGQSAYQTAVTNDVTTVMNNLNNYGLGKLNHVHLSLQSFLGGTPDLFATVYGAGGPLSNLTPWSTPALTYAIEQWQPYAIGTTAVDEVGLTWGYNPLEGTNTGGIIVGAAGGSGGAPTSLSGNGTTCTINWPAPYTSAFTGANRFIITGSGQSALDYSTSANSPIFSATFGSNQLTFPCTYSGATITSGTTQIHSYVANTYTAAGVACPSSNGGNSAACTQWIKYNDLLNARNLVTAVGSNYPKMSWPLAAGTGGLAVSWWSGAFPLNGNTIADYWEQYIDSPSPYYLGTGTNQFGAISVIGDTIRGTSLKYGNPAGPVILEGAGTHLDYLFQGYPITVTSVAGNAITTSTPHLVYNVIPDMTKLWITGSSGANFNFYVISSPTATTLNVALANATFSGGGTGGTITFDDGNFFTLSSISSSTTGNNPGTFVVTGGCPPLKNERGHRFTISGNSNSNYNTNFTGYYDWQTLDSCSSQSYWRQIPNLSSTGGTAYIVPDLWYRRGIAWPSDGEAGVRWPFALINEVGIERGSGVRVYAYTQDPQYYDRTVTGVNNPFPLNYQLSFNPLYFLTFQAGMEPLVDYSKSHLLTHANATANIIHERITKYEFQPVLNSPDYGIFYEASARRGSYGNLLEIQYFGDVATSCTANLSPYLVIGQSIIRISATWAGIEPITVLSPGSTSDTMTCNPGEYRAYLFPVSESTELNQPTISVRLADVTNAASVAVQFSYSPLAFTSASTASQLLYQTFNCGTGAACTLPVDKNFGTIWYRLLFLNSSGALLATSDVQTL
jgi:hypothetical protein